MKHRPVFFRITIGKAQPAKTVRLVAAWSVRKNGVVLAFVVPETRAPGFAGGEFAGVRGEGLRGRRDQGCRVEEADSAEGYSH